MHSRNEKIEIPLISAFRLHNSTQTSALRDHWKPFLSRPYHVSLQRRSSVEPRLLIILEPHMDDAVLSVGGLLARYPGNVRVITVWSRSESVHPQVCDLIESSGFSVGEMRRKECEAMNLALDIEWTGLGFDDLYTPSDSGEVDRLSAEIRARLKEVIPQDALVLLPAGFGGHPHHLLLSDCARDFPLHAYYEDVSPVPGYARLVEDFWPRYDELIRDYDPAYIDIGDFLDRKLELASIYRSQYSSRQARSLSGYARAVALSISHLDHPWPRYAAAERIFVKFDVSDEVRGLLNLGGHTGEAGPKKRWRSRPGWEWVRDGSGETDELRKASVRVRLRRGADFVRQLRRFCSAPRTMEEISKEFSGLSGAELLSSLSSLEQARILRVLPQEAGAGSHELLSLPEPDLRPPFNPESQSTLRQSRRSLTGRSLDLTELSTVLHHSCRVVRADGATNQSFRRFPYPTAGGLGSTQVIVLAWNVEKTEAGVYRYDPIQHGLRLLSDEVPARSDFRRMINEQDWGLGASAAFLVCGDLIRCSKRYRNRAANLLRLESGHCSQALQVALCSVGLSCVAVGLFDRDAITEYCDGLEPFILILASPGADTSPSAGPMRSTCWLKFGGLNGSHPAVAASITDSILHSPNSKLETRNLGSWQFHVARQPIPSTSHYATGWSIEAGPGETISRYEFDKARVKAIAEAREIWAASSAVPDDLVLSTAESLPNRVVAPGDILIDAEQLRAVRRRKVDPTLGGRAIHWVRSHDLTDGEALWVPADAVLLSARFFDRKVLPSSTGLGCHSQPDRAIDHAVLEVFEKAILPAFDIEWQAVNREDFSAESLAIAEAIEAYDQAITVRAASIAGIYCCETRCEPSGITGSAARTSLAGALLGSLGECFSALIEGAWRLRTNFDAGFKMTPPPAATLDSFLNRSQIRLAGVELSPLEERKNALPEWPVVKVIAFRDRDKCTDE